MSCSSSKELELSANVPKPVGRGLPGPASQSESGSGPNFEQLLIHEGEADSGMSTARGDMPGVAAQPELRHGPISEQSSIERCGPDLGIPPGRRGERAAETELEQRNISSSETSPSAKKPFDADEHLLQNLVWFLANMDEESSKYSEILAWYAFLKTGKYEAEGRHEDLLDAISRLEESVRTTPEGDPKFGERLHLLGGLFQWKFEFNGQLQDLDEAILYGELAVLALPVDKTDLAEWIQKLANMYRVRFEQRERIEDLDSAIERGRQAVDLAPEHQPHLAGWYTNLAAAYQWRFERTGQMNDLDWAIRVAESAIQVTPKGDLALPGRLHNLADKLEMRFDETKEMEDLNMAICRVKLALQLSPEDHYRSKSFRLHLEQMLEKRQNPTRLTHSRVISSSVEDPLLVYEKIYSNLKLGTGQTRLLSLRKESDAPGYPPPVCTLRVVNLQQPPPYVSLSYTWGSQAFDHTLKVNGQNLSVTRSCFDAVRLMLAHGCTEVWIDQICIDQSNVAERGQQVSLMDKIYHAAGSVFVWLGRAGSEEWLNDDYEEMQAFQVESALAYRRGHRIDSNPAFWQKVLAWAHESTNHSKSDVPVYDLNDTISLMHHLGDILRNPGTVKNEGLLANGWAWVGFVDLLARPYYSRRWTVQEHWSSSEVHVLFGDRKLDWKVVQDAAMCLYAAMQPATQLRLPIPHCCGPFLVASSRELENIFAVITLKISTQADNERAFPFLKILRQCKATRTKEPGDKIYALLSLVAEREILPQADYNIPAPVVFKECMIRLIEAGQGAEVLLLAGHRRNRTARDRAVNMKPSGLPRFATNSSTALPSQTQASGNDLSHTPTWCPHFLWELLDTSFPLCWAEHNMPGQLPQAMGGTKCRITIQKQHNRLIVEGSIIDTVVDVQRSLASAQVDMDEFLVFQQFAAAHAKHNDISIRENYLTRRTLHMFEEHQGIPPPLQQSSKYDQLEVALRFLQIPDEELPLDPTTRMHMVFFLQRSMVKANPSCRLCATEQGYIGVCSYEAKRGDKLALLHGVSMLMILRPVADNTYEIVGDAYFSGLSNGEALELSTYEPGELYLV